MNGEFPLPNIHAPFSCYRALYQCSTISHSLWMEFACY